MSAEPRFTVATCRHEMDKRLTEQEKTLGKLIDPGGCIATIKKHQNKVLGGIGAVVALIAIAGIILGVVLSSMKDSMAESKEVAMSAKDKVHEVETSTAVLQTELKNLTSKIKEQSDKIDKQTVAMGKLVITIQDMRLEMSKKREND